MARLGEVLLEEKLITKAQLEEGLETQVVYGGRLGTNLCELGFVKEADLARVLGKLHNLPFSSGDMIPDPAALGLFEAAYLDDHDVLPMRVDATRLTVAVLGPKQIEAVDAMAFKASKRAVQVVIPEFRMNQLLRRYCKAFRPMRPIDMNTLRPSKQQTASAHVPKDASELINEDDFASIYAAASAPEEEAVIEGEVLADDVPVVPGVAAPVPSAPIPMPSVPKPAKPKRPTSPLTFDEAQKLLHTSTDREDIARTVLRFAVAKFRRALILNVQGDLVMGWRGAGKGVSDKNVQRIGVSLREANTFKMVRDLRSHFVGPMKPTPGMDVFYKLIGSAAPATAVVLPLLVRGKPVHLLYLDAGPGQMTPPDVGELLIVSQGVTRSYEALIQARQAHKAS